MSGYGGEKMKNFLVLKELTKQYAHSHMLAVDNISLSLSQGEIITLLGPSGCGKTTTLRLIAGFEQPTAGSIELDGRILVDSEQYMPAEARGIGMVFQDYALFPHLNVYKNVLFGLHRWPKKDRQQRVQAMLRLVGLEEYAERFPHQLSGGQQQRVALARALAPDPKLLLLDEPFSNLDAKLREKMREELVKILRSTGTTAILVTHDQQDAFAVSDRVVVMNEGQILQEGSPSSLYLQPTSPFVAQFFGQTNLIEGEVLADGRSVRTKIGQFSVKRKLNAARVQIAIRPENTFLVREGGMKGIVQRLDYQGPFQTIYLRLTSKQESIPWIVYAPLTEQVKIGEEVEVKINPELIHVV